ncbi:MAG: anthranilate phosphoribosyltransferase [Micromonosporaceae bacterium]
MSASSASSANATGGANTGRTTWPALIGALVKGESLTAGQAAWAMNEIMSGEATSVQIAGFGIALRAKGETVAEMTGLAQAMLDHALPLHIPGRVVDLVGTGGDGARTVNISTMGAIVAAAAGARMAKHGNRAASSACGAADVLEALGIVIDLPPAMTQRVVEETGIAFLFAPLYHPALRHAAAARSELGVPTVFNFLGPVANPARPQALAIGVASERMCDVIAGVLAVRGCSGLVFHGGDGLDELTTTTTSSVWVVRPGAPGGEGEPGRVSRAVLDPADLGIARSRIDDLKGGDAAANAAVAHAVLNGERGPVRDTVLLNAAAALAADAGVDGAAALTGALREGYERAAQAIDSGAAAALLARWAETTQRLAKAV